MTRASQQPKNIDQVPIVGIGASAGGLDGFRRFFQAMPFDSGAAFVLIQHLDPAHESLTAVLLARHTLMPVFQARDRMRVQANHIYVIPPNNYLTIAGNALRLSEPVLDHGQRMSIDFFFHGLARVRREKAICIILSGTGTDGTLGLRAVKAEGGLAMAQSPETAQYGGMAQSAIATGLVDYVDRVEALPEKLLHYLRHAYVQSLDKPETLLPEAPDQIRSILAVLHARTKFDFRCYKKGTLMRRIARRMAINQIDRLNDYLSYLREHSVEVTRLFKDLLIGVTGFFREPEAFKALQEAIAPMVANKEPNLPLRVWVPGCASGEEAYSIAMTLIEQLQAAQKDCPLQLFATDIDQEALAEARAGIYPENIDADVAPERLRQFFIRKRRSFEVSKALRECVVFAPHNLITDPPFSKLDLVSCRNLLIYLQSEIQRKLIALFHFALNEGGCLFLGSAESIRNQDDFFAPCSKKWRIYRRIGGVHRNGRDFSILNGKVLRALRQGSEPVLSSDPVRLAKLTQQALVEAYAPASVLVNRKHKILYYSGSSGRYLKQPSGAPTDNLLERAGEGLQHRLRSALYQAAQTRTPVVVGEVRIRNEDGAGVVEVMVRPVALPEQSEDPLFLVSFRDQPEPEALRAAGERPGSEENPLVLELEEQLTKAREELQHTVEEQETYTEELRAANEEVMSANEELQSANEELATSKEELQSLNEELSTLNNQLQEKVSLLEASNNDLANLLVSTDIATLFLDREFRIKRYTPATTQVLRLIASDIGRPLSDIAHQFQDDDLVSAAGQVLERLTPHESEIRTVDGRWYHRRIRPYRTEDDRIQGVVVTFSEITVRKRSEEVLRQAKEAAEQANTAKTRFLAAASHDLRQPLAALTLFNAALTAKGNNPEALEIIEKQGKALIVLGGLLESLLNLSKLEAGVLTPKLMVFPAQSLLERMRLEFEEQARAKGLTLRVRSCPYAIRSDPELLDRMLGNLLANAIEYTSAGGVLLGWRRRGRKLRLEIWDSGPGIPPDQLEEIFAEFHQSDNPIRTRQRQGLGLGLSIVKRLAQLLGHALNVRSRLGKGAVFAVEVPVSSRKRSPGESFELSKGSTKITLPPASVLLIEDNEAVLDSLRVLLESLSVVVRGASSGREAFRLAAQSSPDLIIADHRLRGETGIAGIHHIREALGREVPAIILTGDTSPETVKLLEGSACRVLYKPVDGAKLAALMQDLLARSYV